MPDVSTSYFLRDGCRSPTKEITGLEYEALRRAHVTLSRALAVEEIYEILVSNFLEFECFLLNEAATATLRYIPPYDQLFQIRMGATTRLVNLLTAARMYVDQVPSKVADCFHRREDQVGTIKNLFSREYDAHREYRFMEALRNYVQHRGFPVHMTVQGGG